MNRRDLLKLCTASVAIAAAPRVSVRQAAARNFEDTPLELMILDVHGEVMGRGESRPVDGAHGRIEFDVMKTGIIACVVVKHLDTDVEQCRLYPSRHIGFNSLIGCVGDSVRIDKREHEIES